MTTYVRLSASGKSAQGENATQLLRSLGKGCLCIRQARCGLRRGDRGGRRGVRSRISNGEARTEHILHVR